MYYGDDFKMEWAYTNNAAYSGSAVVMNLNECIIQVYLKLTLSKVSYRDLGAAPDAPEIVIDNSLYKSY